MTSRTARVNGKTMKHLARCQCFIVFYIFDIFLVVSLIPKPMYFRVLSKVYDYRSKKWLSLIVIDNTIFKFGCVWTSYVITTNRFETVWSVSCTGEFANFKLHTHYFSCINTVRIKFLMLTLILTSMHCDSYFNFEIVQKLIYGQWQNRRS